MEFIKVFYKVLFLEKFSKIISADNWISFRAFSNIVILYYKGTQSMFTSSITLNVLLGEQISILDILKKK